MKNLSTAIYVHFNELNDRGNRNAFWTDVQGKLYKGRAPEGTQFPYAVFSLVAENHTKTYAEHFRNPLIQFSLFSGYSSTDEIEDMYTDLKLLFDEAEFSITNNELVSCRVENAELIPEIFTTKQWTREIWHYAVDFDLQIQQHNFLTDEALEWLAGIAWIDGTIWEDGWW